MGPVSYFWVPNFAINAYQVETDDSGVWDSCEVSAGAKGLEVVVAHDGDGREARGHAEPEGQASKRT